jgi:transcription antitermination factor NusG
MPKHWYVAAVKPAKQGRIERQLRLRDFRIFNPRVRRKFPKSDGNHLYRIGPYLPGYLFVNFDIDRDFWWGVLEVDGVWGFICNEIGPPGEDSEGRWPQRVRRGVVPAMMAEFGERFVVDERKLDELVIRVGDRVRIRDGAYADFVPTVVASSEDRIGFILELFGKSHRVELPRESVELIGRTA